MWRQTPSMSEDAPWPPLPFPGIASGTSSISAVLTIRRDTVSSTEPRDFQSLQRRLDQAWFWTPEWQRLEREADEDIAAGRCEEFETIDSFIEGLGQLMGQ